MPANRNKLAFYYFMAAVLLFAGGYGLAWFSEQPLFSQEVFPRSQTTQSTATPSPAADEARPDDRKPSTKPGRQYEVQPGDTISGIAGQNGADFEELAEYNNIPFPYDLTPGQIIVIPEP